MDGSFTRLMIFLAVFGNAKKLALQAHKLNAHTQFPTHFHSCQTPHRNSSVLEVNIQSFFFSPIQSGNLAALLLLWRCKI